MAQHVLSSETRVEDQEKHEVPRCPSREDDAVGAEAESRSPAVLSSVYTESSTADTKQQHLWRTRRHSPSHSPSPLLTPAGAASHHSCSKWSLRCHHHTKDGIATALPAPEHAEANTNPLLHGQSNLGAHGIQQLDDNPMTVSTAAACQSSSTQRCGADHVREIVVMRPSREHRSHPEIIDTEEEKKAAAEKSRGERALSTSLRQHESTRSSLSESGVPPVFSPNRRLARRGEIPLQTTSRDSSGGLPDVERHNDSSVGVTSILVESKFRRPGSQPERSPSAEKLSSGRSARNVEQEAQTLWWYRQRAAQFSAHLVKNGEPFYIVPRPAVLNKKKTELIQPATGAPVRENQNQRVVQPAQLYVTELLREKREGAAGSTAAAGDPSASSLFMRTAVANALAPVRKANDSYPMPTQNTVSEVSAATAACISTAVSSSTDTPRPPVKSSGLSHSNHSAGTAVSEKPLLLVETATPAQLSSLVQIISALCAFFPPNTTDYRSYIENMSPAQQSDLFSLYLGRQELCAQLGIAEVRNSPDGVFSTILGEYWAARDSGNPTTPPINSAAAPLGGRESQVTTNELLGTQEPSGKTATGSPSHESPSRVRPASLSPATSQAEDGEDGAKRRYLLSLLFDFDEWMAQENQRHASGVQEDTEESQGKNGGEKMNAPAPEAENLPLGGERGGKNETSQDPSGRYPAQSNTAPDPPELPQPLTATIITERSYSPSRAVTGKKQQPLFRCLSTLFSCRRSQVVSPPLPQRTRSRTKSSQNKCSPNKAEAKTHKHRLPARAARTAPSSSRPRTSAGLPSLTQTKVVLPAARPFKTSATTQEAMRRFEESQRWQEIEMRELIAAERVKQQESSMSASSTVNGSSSSGEGRAHAASRRSPVGAVSQPKEQFMLTVPRNAAELEPHASFDYGLPPVTPPQRPLQPTGDLQSPDDSAIPTEAVRENSQCDTLAERKKVPKSTAFSFVLRFDSQCDTAIQSIQLPSPHPVPSPPSTAFAESPRYSFARLLREPCETVTLPNSTAITKENVTTPRNAPLTELQREALPRLSTAARASGLPPMAQKKMMTSPSPPANVLLPYMLPDAPQDTATSLEVHDSIRLSRDFLNRYSLVNMSNHLSPPTSMAGDVGLYYRVWPEL